LQHIVLYHKLIAGSICTLTAALWVCCDRQHVHSTYAGI